MITLLAILASLFFLKKKNPKKMIEELNKKYKPEKHPIYNLVASGNLFEDFFRVTDAQSGGKSKDPNDPASKFMPPLPDKDGNYYHTVRDITWKTFSDKCEKLGLTPDPKSFYNMTDNTKKSIVKDFFNLGKKTKSDFINAVLSYFFWGGSAKTTINLFEKVYGSIDSNIKKEGELKTFQKLIITRIEHLKKLNPRYELGWSRALLAFYHVFSSNALN